VFSKIRHLIPTQIAWVLYHSIFKSHLTYCLLIWGNTHPTYLQPLNVIHNKFLRSLLFLPKRTPNSLLYLQASALPIQSLYKYHVAIMIFKFFNLPSTLPPALLTLFQPLSQRHTHSTRTTSSQGLYHLQCASNLRLNQISVTGPQIWNSIPNHIKTSISITIFKKQLHSFLMATQT